MRGYQRASRAQVELPKELEDAQGRRVVDRDGRRLGHVVDVLFDDYHRERVFLEIESEGFLEWRHRHCLAPVDGSALQQDPIVVDAAREELEQLPTHDPSQPFSEEYETAVLGFWGVQMHENVEAVRDPLTERPGESHSMRPEQFDADPRNPHSRRRSNRE